MHFLGLTNFVREQAFHFGTYGRVKNWKRRKKIENEHTLLAWFFCMYTMLRLSELLYLCHTITTRLLIHYNIGSWGGQFKIVKLEQLNLKFAIHVSLNSDLLFNSFIWYYITVIRQFNSNLDKSDFQIKNSRLCSKRNFFVVRLIVLQNPIFILCEILCFLDPQKFLFVLGIIFLVINR